MSSARGHGRAATERPLLLTDPQQQQQQRRQSGGDESPLCCLQQQQQQQHNSCQAIGTTTTASGPQQRQRRHHRRLPLRPLVLALVLVLSLSWCMGAAVQPCAANSDSGGVDNIDDDGGGGVSEGPEGGRPSRLEAALDEEDSGASAFLAIARAANGAAAEARQKRRAARLGIGAGIAAGAGAADDPFPIPLMCSFITRAALDDACAVVSAFAGALVDLPDDECPPGDTAASTGFGRQREPPALAADGVTRAPQPLRDPSIGTPKAFEGALRDEIARREGPTYNWLWQAIRNIKLYWPCSPPFGGGVTGYLIPDGWAPVAAAASAGDGSGSNGGSASNSTAGGGGGGGGSGGTGVAPAPGAPGLYTRRETLANGQAADVPIMAVLRRGAHVVVAVRGSNTKYEWAKNFEYDTIEGPPFTTAAGTQLRLPGRVHRGFASGFTALWPSLSAALAAASAAGAGGVERATVAGHSQGATIAALLAYAAARQLEEARAAQEQQQGSSGGSGGGGGGGDGGGSGTPDRRLVELVSFGGPNVANAEFGSALAARAVVRRILFENDPFALLPCASGAMPACARGPVPTRPAGVGDGRVTGYRGLPGELRIVSAAMPAQPEAWQWTAHTTMRRAKAVVGTNHVCAYICYFRRFSAAAANGGGSNGNSGDGSSCLLRADGADAVAPANGSSSSAPAAAGGGASFCAGFPDTEAPAWPRPALNRQLFDDDAAFPAARPPMFKFRTYADTRGWGCATYRNNTREAWVDHAPLAGVTPAMLAWHYDNLAKGVAASPIDGKPYPHFLLFHPRDHVKHWVAGPLAARPASESGGAQSGAGRGLRAGTKTFWQEVQATGCVAAAEGGDAAAAAPYACPSGPDTPNPGLLAGAPRSSYTGLDQVNSAMVGPSRVRRFVRPLRDGAPAPAGGFRIEFGVRRFNLWPTLTTHTWRADPSDPSGTTTLVSSRLRVGMRLWPRVNRRIADAWRNGLDPDKKCARVALHYIEEFGTLPLWLPRAYCAAKPRAAGCVTPAAAAAAATGGE